VASTEGKRIEAGGQLHFDFEPQDDLRGNVIPAPEPAADVDSLFDTGLAMEDAGRWSEAADAYRRALDIEPADPILHFNLGNVLFALGQADESAQSFRRALKYDPYYAEAWNNLGNACAQREAWRQALSAFRRAVQLVPTYTDAHENLAYTLEQMQKAGKAQVHWDDSSAEPR
jgi:tetratricopeptide (TPR) repeat protein